MNVRRDLCGRTVLHTLESSADLCVIYPGDTHHMAAVMGPLGTSIGIYRRSESS